MTYREEIVWHTGKPRAKCTQFYLVLDKNGFVDIGEWNAERQSFSGRVIAYAVFPKGPPRP